MKTMSHDAQDDISTIRNLLQEKSNEVERLRTGHAKLSKRVRKLLANFPIGLIVVGFDNKIQAINKRAESIFEYSAEELAEQPIKRLFPEVNLLENLSESVRIEGQRKSGIKFPCETTLTIFEFDDIEQYFLSVQDVTEKHELEQMRKDLTAMVSHDIRGPLLAVKMSLEMVGDGLFGDLDLSGKNVIANSQVAVEFLSDLVNKFLDSEKIDSGIIALDYKQTTIGAIVKKSVDTIYGLMLDKEKIRIDSEISNDVITADEDRVVQVLLNLLSNSVKFSPPNSTIKIVAGIEGVMAKFQVIDSGPGIASEKQHLIFERYRQLDNLPENKRKGFGLGLSICKALVELHGGTISVESGPHRGANFFFTIPIEPNQFSSSIERPS